MAKRIDIEAGTTYGQHIIVRHEQSVEQFQRFRFKPSRIIVVGHFAVGDKIVQSGSLLLCRGLRRSDSHSTEHLPGIGRDYRRTQTTGEFDPHLRLPGACRPRHDHERSSLVRNHRRIHRLPYPRNRRIPPSYR